VKVWGARPLDSIWFSGAVPTIGIGVARVVGYAALQDRGDSTF